MSKKNVLIIYLNVIIIYIINISYISKKKIKSRNFCVKFDKISSKKIEKKI